jgi:N-acetylglucosaminyldiphosphoundecaprenol N-acetyl-beta-D-mannosaminyltransferase
MFDVQQLHQIVSRVIENKEKSCFLHANAYLIELANSKHKWLIDFFNEDDKYIMCDGSGVQLAAKVLRLPVPVKIPYNLWAWEFFTFLSKNRYSIFFLGADKETISLAVQKISLRVPNLKIAGFYHGYFEKDSEDNDRIVRLINDSFPNVLFVGFGMPTQELWVKNNYKNLRLNAIFTCGGAFDFFAEKKPVAPLFFRKFYIEWFFRFLLEPTRLFERAIMVNFRFLIVIIKTKIRGI